MKLYELNQAGYASLPDLTDEEILKSKDTLLQFLTTFDSDVYMLLNNESHYYTVFMYNSDHNYIRMAYEILDIAKEIGNIKAIERNGSVVEFWIMYEGECRMFAFFDYDRGVVRV